MGRSQAMSMVSRKSTSSRPRHGGRDPRPIGERHYTTQCARNVEEYLEARGYPLDVTRRLANAQGISSREYYEIFKFLANIRDESLKLDGPMDVEIPAAFKKWKYPFEVKKTKLQNIGAPGSWPELIALLAWLVEFIQADEPLHAPGAFCDGTPHEFGEFEEIGDLVEEEKPQNSDCVPQELKHNAYLEFLQGKDRGELQAQFAEQIQQDLEQLDQIIHREDERSAAKQAELKALQAKHDEMPILEDRRQKSDIAAENLEHEIRGAKIRTDGILERIQAMEAEAQMLERENAQHDMEIEALREQIKAQTMTVGEIQTLKAEWKRRRETDSCLKKDVTQLDAQLKTLAEQEHKVEDDIRRVVGVCNDLLWQVKLAPPEEKRAEGLDLTLRPDLSGPMDQLASYDWGRARRHLSKVSQHLDERSRQVDKETQQSLVEQKRAQEQVSSSERNNHRHRTQVDQQRATNDLLREQYARELDDAEKKAETAEGALHMLMSAPPPSPLEDAEVEQWLRQKQTTERWAEEESETLRAQLHREVKYAASIHHTVKAQLCETLETVKQLERETLRRLGPRSGRLKASGGA